jgi:hypothetical protein
MFRKNPQEIEHLDRIGRQVLRAAAQNEAEIDAAAAAPFLFARVRAKIHDEQRRRDQAGDWLSLPLVAWRAIPAMTLIAFCAVALTLWSSQPGAPSAWQRLDDEALADTRDPGVEQTILSSNALSREEVFSIVVDRNDRENR